MNHRELVTFIVRLVFVLANVVFGYYLLSRLRRRASRFYPLSFAFVGYAAILAFVMSADYITDYVDPLDWSPLVLSLFGSPSRFSPSSGCSDTSHGDSRSDA